jgi:hypothetical protein
MLPLEAIPTYGIMIEIDKYIDARPNQRHLLLTKREYMFE